MIPKYSKSRISMLYISFIAAMGFDFVEIVVYVRKGGSGELARFFVPFAHSCFNFFTAFAIARQRNSCLWIFEILVGLLLSIASHALNNYLALYGGLPIILKHSVIMIFTLAIFTLLLLTNSAYPWRMEFIHPIEKQKQESIDEDTIEIV